MSRPVFLRWIDTTSGSGGGGSACDDKSDCDQCVSCAKAQLCAAELQACQDDAACLGLDECIAICGGNVSCEQDCYDTNAVGAPLYDALKNCFYCEACPSDCGGRTTCS